MNITKRAIIAKVKAYSKVGDREKTRKRSEELRKEIDAASKQARKEKG